MNKSIELINFLDLSIYEKKMLLLWRNHPSVKKWMYNSEDILLNEHLSFIESLKKSKDKLYFLLKKENLYLGVIDFTNITIESCEFGLYAKVGLKGYGKLLLNCVIEYAFETLKVNTLFAEVFEANIKAIRLYTDCNFQKIGSKVIRHQKLILMELSNENRRF